ncbi:MAG: hypothetical protein OQL20_00425 [Sedimenticola sp.]|nr:hypothetical protein [Sedimenticola sp.]
MYVEPGKVEIHSDPIHENLINVTDFIKENFRGTDGVGSKLDNNFSALGK